MIFCPTSFFYMPHDFPFFRLPVTSHVLQNPWLEFSSGSCHRIENCGSIQESAGRLDLPASFPLQPDTPQWRAAGVYIKSSKCVAETGALSRFLYGK